MSENGILANIFRMGDQVKRNLRDFAGNPGDYLDNIAHQNNIEWKKDPIERSMGFFNPVPLGNVSPFMLRKQMKEAIKEITSKPRIPPLPQESINQALKDFPEVPKELMEKYMKQAYKTGVAEKTSNPDTWSQAQRTMYDMGDWKGFSKSRGYSKEEIADFDEMLSLHKQMGEYLPDKKGPNGEAWDDLGSIDAFLVNPHVEKTKELLSSFEKNPIQSTSRRDFMKKSAGIAGGTAAASIPGAKLLQKFAPEERAAVKQAAVEAAPKYKYNSLKEYLDDVETKAYSAHDNPVDYQMLGDDASSIPNLMREQLIRDESLYKQSKFNYDPKLKDPVSGNWIDPFTGNPRSKEFLENVPDTTKYFSPQAKKEMKEFKSWSDVAYDGDWALGATKEFPR